MTSATPNLPNPPKAPKAPTPPKPPNHLPWPPILYVAALCVSWVVQTYVPVEVMAMPVGVRVLGAALMALGILFDSGAMIALYKGRTTILPNKAASYLVTTWPFSISRNPIYLGNTLALAGLALMISWPWLLVMTAMTTFLVTRLAIVREERHLEAVFKDAWQRYRARTPRWIWWL